MCPTTNHTEPKSLGAPPWDSGCSEKWGFDFRGQWRKDGVSALGGQRGACWKTESVPSLGLSGSWSRAGTARRGGLRPPPSWAGCSHHTQSSKTCFYGCCGGCCFPWGCCLCLCIYVQTHLVLVCVRLSEVWCVCVPWCVPECVCVDISTWVWVIIIAAIDGIITTCQALSSCYRL